MYTILNPNSNKVQAGNGWEDQLCGMKSMAFKGSGRPGRRDSIEEDSIFRFLYFSFQRLLHLTFPALARLWWARVTRSTPTSATTTLQATTWRPNNLFLFHISDPVIIWIIVNLNSDQIILNSDQIWSFYSSSHHVSPHHHDDDEHDDQAQHRHHLLGWQLDRPHLTINFIRGQTNQPSGDGHGHHHLYVHCATTCICDNDDLCAGREGQTHSKLRKVCWRRLKSNRDGLILRSLSFIIIIMVIFIILVFSIVLVVVFICSPWHLSLWRCLSWRSKTAALSEDRSLEVPPVWPAEGDCQHHRHHHHRQYHRQYHRHHHHQQQWYHKNYGQASKESESIRISSIWSPAGK